MSLCNFTGILIKMAKFHFFSVKSMQVKYITRSSLHSTVDKPSNGSGCVIGIAIVHFLLLCNGREVAPAFA